MCATDFPAAELAGQRLLRRDKTRLTRASLLSFLPLHSVLDRLRLHSVRERAEQSCLLQKDKTQAQACSPSHYNLFLRERNRVAQRGGYGSRPTKRRLSGAIKANFSDSRCLAEWTFSCAYVHALYYRPRVY
jgi:hypothetical protein